MKKISKIIYYIVFTAILFFALLLIISVFPITGNIKMLAVLSGSMEPKIHTGSIVIIKPISNYKVGDVITFGPNTKTEVPTTHRITDMKAVSGEIFYKTKGDANNAEDGKEVSEKEVIGKVYLSIPFLGYAINFLKKPFGLMLVIVIPAVIIVYDEIQKIGREFKKMRTKKKEILIEEPKNENNKE